MLHHTVRGPVCALLAAAALAASAAAAGAATAHNSQAGAYGPTSDQCAPTPYFRSGGCASAALLDERRYPFHLPATPARPDRRSPNSGGPADAFDD